MFDRLLPDIFSGDFWRKTWQEIQLVWRVSRDPRVPRWIRMMPLVMIIYLVSPFDLVPGFIPVLGQIDDLALIVLGLRLFVRLAPQPVVTEHRMAMGMDQV